MYMLLCLLLPIVESENSLNQTCKNGVKTANNWCVCSGNFEGLYCDLPKCINGERNGNFCHCQLGFTGQFCDTEFCVHGKWSENDEQCFCENHWEGQRCNLIVCGKKGIRVFDNEGTFCACTFSEVYGDFCDEVFRAPKSHVGTGVKVLVALMLILLAIFTAFAYWFKCMRRTLPEREPTDLEWQDGLVGLML